MAEEFENYEARLEAARRAVERWEADGGAQKTTPPSDRTPNADAAGERALPPGEPGEATHLDGEATEG